VDTLYILSSAWFQLVVNSELSLCECTVGIHDVDVLSSHATASMAEA